MKNINKLYRNTLISCTLLGIVLMQAGCSGTRMYSQSSSQTYMDPVCGTTVEARTELKYEYEGRTYYFSSAECLAVFKENPGRFAQDQNRHYGHMGMHGMGWWGPALGGIMVIGMTIAMIIGLNH